jgi:ribosomal protein S18 acetylase RimI-like enzyme
MSETSGSIELSVATEADLPAVLEMMADFNRIEGITWDRESGTAPLRRLLAAPELGVVGLLAHAGDHVGYCVLTWGFDLEYGGRDAFLTEFYLRPEARGRGLGGPAMTRVLALARAHGAAAVHLMVRHENAAALRVYERAGFVSPGRLLLSKRL